MIRFGVLGAARIVPNALIAPCAEEPRAAIHCIAARDPSRAEQFAKAHSIPVVHSSYFEVIDDPTIDALYNPLPISLHHRWTLEALAAGKHVLCEKSFSANAREAEEMARAATESGRVLMDAFHYRYHPAFRRAREIVAAGRLGRVESVEACFHVPITDPADIRLNYETGRMTTAISRIPSGMRLLAPCVHGKKEIPHRGSKSGPSPVHPRPRNPRGE